MSEQEQAAYEVHRLQQMQKLRKETHQKMDKELKERLKNDPNPTEEEILIGAHREMLEPQVRNILFELNKKGYSTESSGFWGEFGEKQAIDGYFDLDEQTKERLKEKGFEVFRGDEIDSPGGKNYTDVMFEPERADLEDIQSKWQEFIQILPDRNMTADPSISGGSEEWREQYVPNRKDIHLKVLNKRISVGDIDPEIKKKWEDEINQIQRELAIK